jgi:hypothetical protein
MGGAAGPDFSQDRERETMRTLERIVAMGLPLERPAHGRRAGAAARPGCSAVTARADHMAAATR